jgi:hypothetical protein
MLASAVDIRGFSIAIRDGLWAFLSWLADAISHEVIPLTGDPEIDAALIDLYLRGYDY